MWLCQWQADVKSKWRLASTPYTGGTLFGEFLDPILIENMDKRKVLPLAARKADHHSTPFYLRSSFWTIEQEGSSHPSRGIIPNVQTASTRSRACETDYISSIPTSGHFEELAAISSVGKSDSIGGCLSLFIDQWMQTITDNWVLNTVRLGLSLEFLFIPLNHFVQCPVSHNNIKCGLVEAICHFFETQAIEPVPEAQWRRVLFDPLHCTKVLVVGGGGERSWTH